MTALDAILVWENVVFSLGFLIGKGDASDESTKICVHSLRFTALFLSDYQMFAKQRSQTPKMLSSTKLTFVIWNLWTWVLPIIATREMSLIRLERKPEMTACLLCMNCSFCVEILRNLQHHAGKHVCLRSSTNQGRPHFLRMALSTSLPKLQCPQMHQATVCQCTRKQMETASSELHPQVYLERIRFMRRCVHESPVNS